MKRKQFIRELEKAGCFLHIAMSNEQLTMNN